MPVEHLGEYLYQRRLQAVRSYVNSRGQFVVEVIDKPIISTEMEAPDAAG